MTKRSSLVLLSLTIVTCWYFSDSIADDQSQPGSTAKKHHTVQHHKKQLSVVTDIANGKAAKMVNGEDMRVDTFTGIPAAKRSVTIVCSGPNPIYYHTEGNAPWCGTKDNGTVAPGAHYTYCEAAATVNQPEVWLTAKYGDTQCAVLFGDVNQQTIDIYSKKF